MVEDFYERNEPCTYSTTLLMCIDFITGKTPVLSTSELSVTTLMNVILENTKLSDKNSGKYNTQ